MKKITILISLMISSLGFSQTYLPLTFTNADQLMTGSDASVTSLVPDPLDGANQVMQIVGDATKEWDTASLVLTTSVNLEDNANNTITFRINPMGITGIRNHILKFEGPGAAEFNFTTTDSGWQTITANFGPGLVAYSKVLIFTDKGSATETGTYLVDDIMGATNNPLSILTLPLRFTATNELFAGDGNVTTSLVADPLDALNKVMKVEDLVGGEWSNALLNLNPSINLSDNAHNTITFRINPIGVTGTRSHLLKFQGAGQVEHWFSTTDSGWQTITANFGAGLGSFPQIVIFPDAGSLATGTYLIDDIEFASQVLLNAEDGTSNKLGTMNVFANGPGQSNADMIVVTNPNGSGINTSTKCIQFTRRTSGTDAMPWAGFYSFVTDPDPDFTTNKYVHVKLMKSNTSPVKFKIEGGPTGTIEIYSINSYTTPGVWQDMVFDFSDRSGLYPIVAFLPDFEDPLIAGADRMIYFDDIVVNNIATPETLGLKENYLSAKVKMYPNPVKNTLTIDANGTIQKVSVYNVLGQEVMKASPKNNSATLQTSQLKKGVYFVTTDVDGVISTSKVLKD
ncbi:T9SS type A sorting domain-containing protein [Flavobacterium franklandianum]|uniref:T9SS type A sorting domain-containing protein n=1 Tax=Flavobacterium franklandianum TaxID=2594430 RepID=A0A553CJ01_9FLAO|nr:T9SS type A sorting domain-containing protein [Flavobacterium franklandianum]TRX20469.1 T9SS type A sorting domain-containing protein [Flavobacterium franklandianum]